MRTTRLTALAAIAVLALAACRQAGDAGIGLADPSAVDRVIDGFVDAGAFPFLYARLEDADGNVIYEHGKVNDDLLPGVNVDGQTWIRIWSMSKIVTIAVVLDLIEEGVLRFDDAVSDYIPEFETLEVVASSDGADSDDACPLSTVPVETTMTVLDLLNHTAGFYYTWTGIPCLDDALAAANLPAAEDSDDLIRRMAALPLVQQPGAGYFYGTNTTVLGLVAERASGKSLKALVEERITEPLGISGLQYYRPANVSLLPRFSGADGTLRAARDGELDIFGAQVPDYEPDHALYLGGEGMLGTADGYADFLRMLLNDGELNGHRLLDESTIDDLTSPHSQTDNPFGHNGYNLWVSSGKLNIDAEGRPGLWQGGGYEYTHFWIDPEYEFVGVIMSQMFAAPEAGAFRDEHIRTAIYEQINAALGR